MSTLYSAIVIDIANKLKREPLPEVECAAMNYERMLGTDWKKLIEEARKVNAKAA